MVDPRPIVGLSAGIVKENPMTCIRCNHENVKRFGTYGKKKIQRYRCQNCKTSFSDTRHGRFGHHYLTLEQTSKIISLMLEGVSIRAIGRLTRIDRNTILSVLLTAGVKARSLFNTRIRKVRAHFIQLDETWTFVHTKEKHLARNDPQEWGDAYTWVGLDSETKLVISYLVGKRDAVCANEFVKDLNNRVIGRCQITSDGFRPYIEAVEEAWGADVDFAQLIKIYGRPDNSGPEWYRPGSKVIDTISTPISGDPHFRRISTSHVERANLTLPMHLRRFTRLVNAFSKSLAHLKAGVALYMAWYNFCRVHQTLRVTPAMEAGITDHIWSVNELIALQSEVV